MADEKRKIKIIPEKYRHDIGEVEITIDEQEIKDYGFITAYKNKLKTMLERVKNNGFHMAVQNNTNYKIINMAKGFLWQNEDEKEELLKQWLCESLENEINELKKNSSR